jgi:nucleotide-binding universal stress UspA family protein
MPEVAKRPDLVAIDGSLASERAVSYAVSQARLDGRPLVFVHVVETADRRDDANPHTPSIDAALRTAATAGVRAEARILQGRPREEIIAAALDVDPRFVFVGACGLTGAELFVLGSVAADVARHSDKPVIVVPPVAHPPTDVNDLFSNMLVPINAEAPETSPAASAIALAIGTTRRIAFCAVVDENRLLRIAAQADGAIAFGDLVTDVRTEALRVIDAATTQARDSGVAADGSVVSGEPVQTICALAGRNDVTCIVIGTRGRQGLPRIFLGSTTQGVLGASRIPVVTLRLGHGLLEPVSDRSGG